jgi:hypothetical protein
MVATLETESFGLRVRQQRQLLRADLCPCAGPSVFEQHRMVVVDAQLREGLQVKLFQL